jgi:hypothetical protein
MRHPRHTARPVCRVLFSTVGSGLDYEGEQTIGLFWGLLITIYKAQFSDRDFSPSEGVGSFM